MEGENCSLHADVITISEDVAVRLMAAIGHSKRALDIRRDERSVIAAKSLDSDDLLHLTQQMDAMLLEWLDVLGMGWKRMQDM
jgi:hypothetical protein